MTHPRDPTTCEKMNAALARALVKLDCFRVHGRQEGYRNKMCYSLTPPPPRETDDDRCASLNSNTTTNNNNKNKYFPFQVSNQAIPVLNDVSTTVNRMTHEFLASKQNQINKSCHTMMENANDKTKKSAKLDEGAVQPTTDERDSSAADPVGEEHASWDNFFVEVTAKITRLNEIMVKLAVTHPNSQQFVSSGDGAQFADELCRRHPSVRCVILQVAPPGKPKGTKFEASEAAGESSCSASRKLDRNDDDGNDENVVSANVVKRDEAVVHQQQPATRELNSFGDDPASLGRYIPLFENRTWLFDLTPNGLPVRLSADSFTEVNYEMEVEMHRATLRFLGIPARCCCELGGVPPCCCPRASSASATAASTTTARVVDKPDPQQQLASSPPAPTAAAADPMTSSCSKQPHQQRRAAIIVGRDCNVVYNTVKHVYGDRVFLVTNCPRAKQDAAAMGLPNFVHIPKEDITDVVLHGLFPERRRRMVDSSVNDGNEVKDNNKNDNNNDANDDDDDDDDDDDVGGDTTKRKHSARPEAVAGSSWDILVTAGRHGLHPRFSEGMIQPTVAPHFSNFLYTSCNLDSLTRDLHVLRRAYFVKDAATFDFFPQTKYQMTMVHLVPRNTLLVPSPAGGMCRLVTRKLLVLPVGLPGVSKSSCSQEVAKILVQEPPPPPPGGAQTRAFARSKKQNNNSNDSSTNPPVLRSLNRRREPINCVSVFERDEIFAQERQKPNRSLSATKTEVHKQLLSFLGGCALPHCNNNNNNDDGAHGGGEIFILDSSNGSREQRREYTRLWLENNKSNDAMCRQDTKSELALSAVQENEKQVREDIIGSRDILPVVEIFFDPFPPRQNASSPSVCASTSEVTSAVVDLLVKRCLGRQNHPAFPAEEADARKKIETILTAIEPPLSTEENRGGADEDDAVAMKPRSNPWYRVECGASTSWKSTLDQFCWCVFLAFYTDSGNVGTKIFKSMPSFC